MKSILLAHARKYPLMEPTDAVKLLYQSEFGGGHLIRNEAACLDFLRREYASVCQTQDIPLSEDIGNNMVRVNLGALDAAGLSLEALGEAFLRSAVLCQGTMDSFRKKLALLAELTDAGQMPFSPDALKAYLSEYENAGFSPVSHSEAYRAAYHPAYRIVKRSLLIQNLKL